MAEDVGDIEERAALVGWSKMDMSNSEHRLALGKRVHDREWGNVEAAAEVLGFHKSFLYTIQREYREAEGMLTARAKRGSESMRLAHAARRATKGNGNGGEHVSQAAYAALTVTEPNPERASVQNLKQRLAETEARLEAAMDECHVLQKLLMTVGRTL